MNEILYADDLVLMCEMMEGLKEKCNGKQGTESESCKDR